MTILRVILRDGRRSAVLVLAALVLDFLVLYALRHGGGDSEIAVWLVRLLMLAIGADVVLGDPVSGDQAQWRTRPVSGAAMAVGKTLMLAGVALGVGLAMLAVELLSGAGVWPGVTLAVWEVFRAAIWVLLGAALAALVESRRGFIVQAASALVGSAVVVAVVLFLARYSELIGMLAGKGAREHGRAVMAAGAVSIVFAFAAVARRYGAPHRIWLARILAWVACLFVLGHEGLRLLLR